MNCTFVPVEVAHSDNTAQETLAAKKLKWPQILFINLMQHSQYFPSFPLCHQRFQSVKQKQKSINIRAEIT
jgi:hypothetical protein